MDFHQAAKDRLKELEKSLEKKQQEMTQIRKEIKALMKYMAEAGILPKKRQPTT